MDRYWRYFLFVLILVLGVPHIGAQTLALKTNVVYDATTTLNGGVEVAFSKRWTLELSANYNPFSFSEGKKWKHWAVQPEVRYWLCQKMNGHFFGIHALGMEYNLGGMDLNLRFLGTDFRGLKGHRYEGWGVGGGLTYGYAWMLSKHWNVEAAIGLGYVYSEYDRYVCERCGDVLEADRHHFVGPTKVALNLVYVF